MTISKASLSKLQYTTTINDLPDGATPTATDVGTSRAFNNGSATITLVAAQTGGPVTDYTVTSTPGSFTATGTSPLTITGLQSGVSYTFTSKGNNPLGSSYVPSVASNAITATTVPGTPIIGTATKVSNTVVSLSFTPPANGGKAITGYTITSSPSISITTQSGTTSPLTATGSFLGAQQYTFTITATNANGTGQASSASPGIIVANNTVPAKPAAPTAVAGVNKDTVTWVAPANGGSTITGYTWESSDNKTGTVNGTTLSVEVAQEGNTSQTYTVYATNAVGNSLTSDPSNNVTTTPPFFPPFFPYFAPPFFPFFPPYFPGFVYSSKRFKHSIENVISIKVK